MRRLLAFPEHRRHLVNGTHRGRLEPGQEARRRGSLDRRCRGGRPTRKQRKNGASSDVCPAELGDVDIRVRVGGRRLVVNEHRADEVRDDAGQAVTTPHRHAASTQSRDAVEHEAHQSVGAEPPPRMGGGPFPPSSPVMVVVAACPSAQGRGGPHQHRGDLLNRGMCVCG